ncbi:MAG: cytidylate kinase-like family protein [Proteobacteria bacterium]|nr:cytidylate kinase-like family protein [Pseudomonadota bacterium]
MAILTIAREYGSGGKEIGKSIAGLLDYGYVDRKLILEDMKKVGASWEELTKYLDENQPTVIERYEWSYRGFVALNQSHILNYALHDRVVIMGRGGNFLLNGMPHALRIRTTAPIKKRIENVMRWQEINNSEDARFLIEKADKEMAGAVYLIYGSAWDDPEQYDFVFDTSTKTYDEIINIVKEELEKRDKVYTEKTGKVLQLKALAAKIRAEIAINSDLSVSTLEVGFKEEGLVEYGLVAGGVVHNIDDKKNIEEIVKKLSGDVPVEFGFQYRMHPRLGDIQYK